MNDEMKATIARLRELDNETDVFEDQDKRHSIFFALGVHMRDVLNALEASEAENAELRALVKTALNSKEFFREEYATDGTISATIYKYSMPADWRERAAKLLGEKSE